MLLIGLGLGIAMPGYTAGPSLLMERHEQSGLAGLIGATNGLTFVIAPTAGTALYSAWAPLPVIVAAIIMAAVTTFVLTHPRFTRPSRPNHPDGELGTIAVTGPAGAATAAQSRSDADPFLGARGPH